MRASYQVLIIPYRRESNTIKYGIFKRSDWHVYQPISGGGEEGETILETAKREFFEETGLKKEKFTKLDSISCIPANNFSHVANWGPKTYVVKEYTFGLELEKKDKITLSSEHTSYKFVEYDKAMKKLTWDSNKTALYELNERIKNNDL